MQRLEGYPGRLIIAFLVALLMVAAAGTFALLAYRSGAATREAEAYGALEDLMLAERLRADVERTIASGRGFLLAADPSSLEWTREAEADVRRGVHDLRGRIQSSEGEQLLSRLQAAFGVYLQNLDSILEDKAAGVAQEVVNRRFERELLPQREALDGTIDAFLAHRQGRLAAAISASQHGDRVAFGVASGIVVLSILAGGGPTGCSCITPGWRRCPSYSSRASRISQGSRARSEHPTA